MQPLTESRRDSNPIAPVPPGVSIQTITEPRQGSNPIAPDCQRRGYFNTNANRTPAGFKPNSPGFTRGVNATDNRTPAGVKPNSPGFTRGVNATANRIPEGFKPNSRVFTPGYQCKRLSNPGGVQVLIQHKVNGFSSIDTIFTLPARI